ncbi:hypothetical protein [Moumouvirus maliensis]|nr:hypothetical protein [Moumouvirus maliensis]
MVYFPHYISIQCLSSYDKYFDKKKYIDANNINFFISDNKSIPVSCKKFKKSRIIQCGENKNHFCIYTEIKYAVSFMKFIVKKSKKEKFFSQDKFIADYHEYFKYIITNNMTDHIKIFIKKYLPLVKKSYIYEHDLCFNQIYNEIPKEILKKETINLVINSFTISTISHCIMSGIKGPNTDVTISLDLKIIKKLLRQFIKELTRCLTSDPKSSIYKYHFKSKVGNYIIDLDDVLGMCVRVNNPEFFEYVLKKLPSFFDDIDIDEVKNMILYNELYESFEYDKKMAKHLIYDILDEYDFCPKIYEILLNDIEVEYLKKNLIPDIIKKFNIKNNFEYEISYLEYVLFFIYSKTEMDQEFIDNLFLESYNCSDKVIKTLVEYGADYEKYGKKVMKEAKKINNIKVINYIKNLLENVDE